VTGRVKSLKISYLKDLKTYYFCLHMRKLRPRDQEMLNEQSLDSGQVGSKLYTLLLFFFFAVQHYWNILTNARKNWGGG
jgi:hypothetical protein